MSVESLLFLSIGMNIGLIAHMIFTKWTLHRHMRKTHSFVKANEEEYYTEYGNGEPVRGKNVY